MNTTTTENTTQFLSAAQYAATVAKFDAINKRAAKKGLTGRMEITKGELRKATITDRHGNTENVYGYDCEITGSVAINGWSPIAKAEVPRTYAETNPETGEVLVAATPWESLEMIVTAFDEEAADECRDLFVKGKCDHCGNIRKTRRHTYLVRNDETGEIRQVGKTCLKDFLGTDATPSYLDGIIGGGSVVVPNDVHSLIATSIAVIRITGGYNTNRSMGAPTDEMVHRHLNGCRVYGDATPEDTKASIEFSEQFSAIADEVSEQAEAAIAWIMSTTEGGYIGNVRAVVGTGYAFPKHQRLIVSAGQAYLRHLETADERAERAAAKAAREAEKAARKAASRHLGEIGEKITVEGEVAVVRGVETRWGWTMLVIVRTTDGQTVKMFTAAKWARDLKGGEELRLTGTVKSHGEWEGELNTTIKSPRLVK